MRRRFPWQLHFSPPFILPRYVLNFIFHLCEGFVFLFDRPYYIKEENEDKKKMRSLASQRESIVVSRLSMVAEKLHVLLIQEPGLLSGIEEDVKFIYLEMIECVRSFRNFVGGVTEPLRDIAYDVEDFIEELTLKSAATKKRSGGVHKKLEKIKVKICPFRYRPCFEAAILTETVEDQNIAQTIVSPVIEKVTDLLAQASLRSQVKKKARRMEDEFKLINGFLEKVESVEWDNSVMEWLEELCNVSCEAVGVINLFINRKAHVKGNKGAFRRVVTAFNSLRLGVEMDRINARLQDLCERMPQVDDYSPFDSSTDDSCIIEEPDVIIEEPDVISFNDDVQEIVARLLTDDKSFLVISIMGMKGIGKTTLAKLVYDNDAIVHHFPFRAWTSEEQPPLHFLKDILKQMDPNKSIPTLWKEGDNNSLAEDEEEDNNSLAEDEEEDHNSSAEDEEEDNISLAEEEEDHNGSAEDEEGDNNNREEDNNCSAEEEEEGGKSTAEEDNKSITEENNQGMAEEEDLWVKKMREREEEEEELWSLFNALVKDKKCLIVVDDVYWIRIIDKLRTGFSATSSGSRMILILNHPSLLSELPKGGLHLTLQLRDGNESWALFTHILKLTIPPELQSLRGDIVKTCCGVPLIIKKLAAVLSRKDTTIEEWSGVLQRLNEDEEFRSHILYEINGRLPLHMKRCLFYFGLFPQNFEIPARRLIALWIAEGLVYPKEETETPEDVAKKYLTKLIGQCMVQVTKKKVNGEVQACRLPDPIRKQWFLKAKKATFLQRQTSITSSEISLGTGMVRRLVDHLDESDASFTHIHGHHNTISIPLKAHYEATSSFISFDTREGSLPGDNIRNFLHRCISSGCFLLLQVLDLEHVYKPNLPVELGKLTRLRYLGLRRTYLEMLPSSISKLLNLLTLDLKHTNIITLPSVIWKLQQLRHLYLSESYWSKFMHQPSAGSLTALQTLWGLFVDEKTPVKDGLDRLVTLRKLAVKFRLTPSQQEAMLSRLEAVADWVLKLSHLQSLRLTSIDEENQPWELDLKPLFNHVKLSSVYLLGRLKNPSVMSEFPHSLNTLTLSWSGLTEDPMQTLDKLPNLRVLRLLRRSYIGKHMLCPSRGFPQLRVLKLWELEQLEEWNVEERALGALRDLEIRSCMVLRMLPEGLRHRTFLELKLTGMPSQFTA